MTADSQIAEQALAAFLDEFSDLLRKHHVLDGGTEIILNMAHAGPRVVTTCHGSSKAPGAVTWLAETYDVDEFIEAHRRA